MSWVKYKQGPLYWDREGSQFSSEPLDYRERLAIWNNVVSFNLGVQISKCISCFLWCLNYYSRVNVLVRSGSWSDCTYLWTWRCEGEGAGVLKGSDRYPFAPYGEYPHSTEQIESHVKHYQCCIVQSTPLRIQVSSDTAQLVMPHLLCMQHHKHLNRALLMALTGLPEIRRQAENMQITLKCGISLIDCQHCSSNDICTSHIHPMVWIMCITWQILFAMDHVKYYTEMSSSYVVFNWRCMMK